MLDRGDFGEAAALFETFRKARGERIAETAFVGLMNARYGAGRMKEVVRLANEYAERFPRGHRRSEVAALAARAEARLAEQR